MDCQRASILMLEYIDGTISNKEREDLLDHIALCEDCSQEFSLLQETLELIEGLEEIEPPQELEELVMNNINHRLYRNRIRPILGVGVLTMMGLVLIAGYLIYFKGVFQLVNSPLPIREHFISIFANLVYFLVRVLPNILLLVKRITIYLFNIPLYLMGLYILWLLMLAVASTYMFKFINYKVRRN